MEIGFLGPAGSFSYIAAKKIKEQFSSDLELKNYPSFQSLFQALTLGKVEGILVPIENSTGGSVTENIDRFLRLPEQFTTCLEYVLKIDHCLIGFAENLNQVKKVKAHYQAFMQCEDFLAKNFTETELIKEEEKSNSLAIQSLLELKDYSKLETAAIGPEESAEIYQIPLLKKNIQDNQNNSTRFWLISPQNKLFKTSLSKNQNRITSFVFKIPFDQAGGLFEVLSVLANYKINLSKIESRPTGLNLSDYIFLVDFINPESWDLLRTEVINQLKSQSSFFRILGGGYSVISKEKDFRFS